MGLPDNVEELHQIAENYTARRSLRRTGWGGIAFGILNIILGVAFALSLHPINLILCVIGVILLIAAIWCLALPGAEGAIAYGIALILVSLWNILVIIDQIAFVANAPAGQAPPTPTWPIILTIAGIAGAVDCFKKYARFSEGLRYDVAAEEIDSMDKLVKRILKADAKTDESIIGFQAKGFMYQKQWRGRLAENVALFVEKRTKEVLATDRAGMSIEPHGKVLLGKSLKATVNIEQHTWQAVLSPESFDRFREWKFSEDEDKYFRAKPPSERDEGDHIQSDRDPDKERTPGIQRGRPRADDSAD